MCRYGVMNQLAYTADALVVLTPHKNPEITSAMGFALVRATCNPTLRGYFSVAVRQCGGEIFEQF